ncbi:hypothetical protein MTsPCn7_22430 [Altererythrobacter sp. MTPC7]
MPSDTVSIFTDYDFQSHSAKTRFGIRATNAFSINQHFCNSG